MTTEDKKRTLISYRMTQAKESLAGVLSYFNRRYIKDNVFPEELGRIY